MFIFFLKAMSAEEDERREQIAFMVDAILRTVNNLKENFHMYESATRQVLSIAREGMAQPTQVVEPPVQPVNGRSALSTVKVDRKRLASKGSVTSLGSKHLKAATLLVTLFAVFDKTAALAAIKSAPKVLPKMASNIAKNPPISPISPAILARLFKSPGSDKIVDALDKSHDFIQNIVSFVKKTRDLREKAKAKGNKIQPVEKLHRFEYETCQTDSGSACYSDCSKRGFHFSWCYTDSKLNWNYCTCKIKDSIKNFLQESKYGLKVKTWERTMAKMVGTDKIWYLFGVSLGSGALIIMLFLLILYRTCRHYRAKKAAAAQKRPASSPSGVSTPSLSRKPSHKRCPRPTTIHRPHHNGIQKNKVKDVNKTLMESLNILAKQNLVSEKFVNDQMKRMANGGTISYADSNAHVKMMANGVHYIAGSPPMGNKFYHEARTEAEDRMAMRMGGGSGRITPPQAAALNPQAAAYRPPRPAPPGLKKTEQQTEAPRTVVEVEVE